jgi:hypothetical protein
MIAPVPARACTTVRARDWPLRVPPGCRTCGPALALATLVLAGPLAAEQVAPERREVAAVRLAAGEAIALDGRLDEPAWQRAMPAGEFIQQDPDNGAPATERTEVRVLYERHRLYLGVLCHDSQPDRLLGNQMQRDQPFDADDRFRWTLDTYLDGRTGYFFEINPSGAMGDGLVGIGASGGSTDGESGLNRQWDGIWIARVRRTAEGWTAEIELPFRTLNFAPDSTAWGINFQRTIRRKNEETFWSGYARNQGLLRMSNAGLLTGLEDISQGIGLDLKPYAVATAGAAPGRGAPAFRGQADAGVDVFYNLTPGLRANVTVNTDFAETEVDERRVNLTRFPLYYPEKRDFFLEGSSFFDFSREPGNAVVPFFSRRIGLGPEGTPQAITYGVKLTGQAGAQDVGVLQVRTGEADDLPGEDFTVVRVRRRFLTQSYAGMIYTRRAARGTGLEALQTAGVDLSLATSTFRGRENLEFSAFWLWNTNPLGTGGNLGYGARLNYPNDLWNARVSFRELQEHYDPAVGFTSQNGYRRVNPVVRFSPRPRQNPFIRRFSFEAHLDLQGDLRNDLLTRKWDLTVFEVDFQSGDQVQVHVIPDRERLDRPFEISEGIVLPVGATYDFTRYRVEGSTANQRFVAASALVETGEFFSGRRREVGLAVTVRPRPGLLASIEGEWNDLELAEGRFRTSLYRLQLDTQFSPWISLRNTVQYDSVSRLLGWQSRFRWILRPGNDIYVVYTHNWRDDVLDGWRTLDRRAASKVIYTHRF